MDWFHCDVRDGYAIYTNNQEGISLWGAANIYKRKISKVQTRFARWFLYFRSMWLKEEGRQSETNEHENVTFLFRRLHI